MDDEPRASVLAHNHAVSILCQQSPQHDLKMQEAAALLSNGTA